MGGGLVLGLSAIAVGLLVLLAMRLGFGGQPRLEGLREAALLAQGLPRGFDVLDGVLDADGAGAVLRDRDGRLAVLAPLGAHFVVRLAGNGTTCSQTADGELVIGLPDITARLRLGPAADLWTARLTSFHSQP